VSHGVYKNGYEGKQGVSVLIYNVITKKKTLL